MEDLIFAPGYRYFSECGNFPYIKVIGGLIKSQSINDIKFKKFIIIYKKFVRTLSGKYNLTVNKNE